MIRFSLTLLIAYTVACPAQAAFPKKRCWIGALARSSIQMTEASERQYERTTTPELKHAFEAIKDEDAPMTIAVALVFAGEEFRRPVLDGWRLSGISVTEDKTLGSHPMRGGYTATYYQLRLTAKSRSVLSIVHDSRIFWAGTEEQTGEAEAAYLKYLAEKR